MDRIRTALLSLIATINVDRVAPTYGDNNYDQDNNLTFGNDVVSHGYEAAKKRVVDRYTKQGFSWVDMLNDHHDSDKSNRLEGEIKGGFYEHQPVIVSYVDSKGNKLSADDVIAFNHNNPDQRNQGIDPAHNWFSVGHWQSKPKDIAGYSLVKTKGASSGEFTNFTYHVVYVYEQNEPAPNPQPQPTPEPDTPAPKPNPEPTPEPNTPVPKPNPEKPVKPEETNKPAKPDTVKPQATKTSKQTAVKTATAAEKEAQLPQTGTQKSNAGIFGLAIAAVAGLFGLAAGKKKND